VRRPRPPAKQVERERAVAAERDRIMRELHDGLGANLVGALALVEDGASQEEVAEVLRDAIDEMRLVIDSLEPAADDLPTLLGMMRSRLEPRLVRQGLRFEWAVSDLRPSAMPADGLLHVLRILQEAVTNVRKHAGARVVTVSTGERRSADGRDGIWIAVADDGVGISPGASPGRGQANMRYRAAQLGGAIEVRSASPGTVVELWIPVKRS
jgi:signal transduction histidine kinase